MREDNFRSDSIWTTFTQIEAALNAFSDTGKANPEFTDLKNQIAFVRWILEHSDPSLINQSELNQTRNELTQILAYLPADAASYQYLGNIQGQLSMSLVRFSSVRQKRLTRSESSNLLSELKSEIEKLRSELQISSAEVSNQVESVYTLIETERTRLNALRDEISRVDAIASTKFEAWESRIDADYQGKLAAWTSDLSSVQLKSSEQLASLSKSFVDEIEKSRSTLDAIAVEAKKDRQAAEHSLASLYSKMTKDGESTLRNLIGIYEQAGQVALSGGFVEASRNEEASYKIYAKLASGFFICSAIALGVIWYDSVENKLSGLSVVILRIPISIVFLLPAFYFASLASKHRKTAVSLRSLGLRIKAFDAYTIKATEKDRQKLREELAPVFFDEERAVVGMGGNDDAFIGKVVDRLGSVVEKAMDKVPIGKS